MLKSKQLEIANKRFHEAARRLLNGQLKAIEMLIYAPPGTEVTFKDRPGKVVEIHFRDVNSPESVLVDFGDRQEWCASAYITITGLTPEVEKLIARPVTTDGVHEAQEALEAAKANILTALQGIDNAMPRGTIYRCIGKGTAEMNGSAAEKAKELLEWLDSIDIVAIPA